MMVLLPLCPMPLEILLSAVGGWSSHGLDARCSAVFAGAPLTPLEQLFWVSVRGSDELKSHLFLVHFSVLFSFKNE